jgi:universal stress protein E
MYPINRILVAIKDPRARSHPAVAKAVAIATALDAQLQLFHAIDDPVYPDLGMVEGLRLPQLERRQRERYRQLLESIAEPLRRRGVAVSTAVEWDFPLHEAIVRGAAKFGANLIVAADHATVHHLPWLLRYTDWELLRASPVPVLLVKKPRPYRKPVILAALDPTHSFAKPAALDDEILRYSATLAEALKGTVHAVHAFSPVPVNLSPTLLSTPGELDRTVAAAEAAALEVLRHTAEPLGVARGNLHVVGRHPTDGVQDVVRETGSQIVALGSLSRSGLKRLLIGNTAEALIDGLNCDILVVKPPGFRHRIARAPRGARVAPLAPGIV